MHPPPQQDDRYSLEMIFNSRNLLIYRRTRMIAICDNTLVIGYQGQVPWRISRDWNHFLSTTQGSVLILGRLTYEERNHALPGRHTIVLSKSRKFSDADSASSLEEGLLLADKKWPNTDIWICGGAEVYEEGLTYAKDLYLTRVDTESPGDVYFPTEWKKAFPQFKFSRNECEGELKFSIQVWSKE